MKKKVILSLALCLLSIPASFAADETTVAAPVQEQGFKVEHPILYKCSAPVRFVWNKALKKPCVVAWNSAIVIGEKGKPVLPFLQLTGAAANTGAPFVFGFVRH